MAKIVQIVPARDVWAMWVVDGEGRDGLEFEPVQLWALTDDGEVTALVLYDDSGLGSPEDDNNFLRLISDEDKEKL